MTLNPAKKSARKRRAVDRLLCRRVPGLSRTLAFVLICIHINGWHWMKERVYVRDAARCSAMQREGESGCGVDESNRETHVSAWKKAPGMKGGDGIEGNAGPGM